MQLLVDENLPRSVAALLRQEGHEVLHVTDSALRGMPDTEIAAFARQREFCIVTADKGFADIRVYRPEHHFGIIVLRLKDDSDSQYIVRLIQSIDFGKLGNLSGKLVIVDETQVRIRGNESLN